MDRPPLEVADLVRAAGDAFIERSRKWITWKHVKVLLAIARCRTAVLGGHLDECTRCGPRAISYNSCRNRHCPKCRAGVVGDGAMSTASALIEMSAEHGGATPRNGQQHFDMLPGDPLTASFDECVSRSADQIGHLEGRPAHLLVLR